MECGSNTDFMFPIEADIYHPIVEQTLGYGSIKKTWVLDRTVGCSLSPAGSSTGEDVKPNVDLTQEMVLVGRLREDARFSSRESKNAITNVIVTNVRDKNCNPIYIETSGPRAGKSTIFEVASHHPFVGPFGNVEYYKIVLRRSENQAADL
jgi:hypothetical protein